MDDSRPLRLLSLDGGGIRGLSSLYILRAIMRALERELDEAEGAAKQPARRVLPCEYFDLIAGTSTGGLIAVMLGVLRMDIDTCIEEYLKMAPVIFPIENLISGSKYGRLFTIAMGQQRFDPKPLEDAVKKLVERHLGEVDTPLRFEASRDKGPSCKVFLCVTSDKLGKHFRFRNYESSWNDIDDCPIWQACRATSAAPTFFPPMLIGNPPTAYVDGGLGYNNPIRPLLDEARHIWPPTRDIGCIVSIGTGILTSRDIGRKIGPLFESLKDIATDTEKVAREFREEMKHRYGVEQKIYFRFNVQHGLEQVALEEWKEMDRTKVATQEYTGEQWSQIHACASQLRNPTVPSLPAKPAFIVPFEQDNDFVGREDVIKKIDIQFRANRRRVALFGIGGVGKSQIAIEYAHRFKQQHHQVFWVHAANKSRFDQAYQSIAEKLKIHGFDKPEVDTRQLVYKSLNDEDHGNWLMILDNADDTELFFPEPVLDPPPNENKSPSGLAPYIPRNSKGSILITTRNSILGKDLANGNTPIEIEQFSPPDSKILLKSKIPDNCWDAADAGKLVEALGCLPLAITQSAAYVSNYNVSLKEYLAEVENDDLNLKECLSEELQDPRRELGSPNAVFRTWILSFNQIRRQAPRASEILSLMALLDRQGVPKLLLRKEDDQFVEYTKAIGTLQAFSLIRAETGGETFVMHRLVQLSTQNWLEKEGTHVVYREEAVKMLSAKFPNSTFENGKTCKALLPHAQAVLKYSNTTNFSRLDRADLLFNVAWYNISQGRVVEVTHTYSMECYEIRRMLLERNDLKYLASLRLLGRMFLRKKSYRAAEDIFREALLGYEKVLGKECEEALICHNGMATVLASQGKYVPAAKIYQQVFEANEKRLGTKHPDTLSSVYNLGQLFADKGKHDAAEKWFRRAFKGYEETVGWLDPRTLFTAGDLALILGYQRKFDDASSLYQIACAGVKEVYGPDHPYTLEYSLNYSRLLDKMRKEELSQQESKQLDDHSERKPARRWGRRRKI